MNDSLTPPPTPEPSLFGAGVPPEAVEPVRLSPGLAHGPALDVRGQALQSASQADQAAATTAPAALAPQPFVGWIIPAAAGAPGAGTSAPMSSPSPGPVAVGARPEATPPPPAPAAGAPIPAPTLASSPPAFDSSLQALASSSPALSSSPPPPSAQTPPPSGLPPTPTPLPPATKPPRRWWIAIAHLAYLIPFPPGVLVTAAVWIWRRSRDPLMADQGREALNMQLTFWLAMGILSATCVVSPLVPFVYVLGAVLCILAAIAAWGGDRHRYPWVFRFLT